MQADAADGPAAAGEGLEGAAAAAAQALRNKGGVGRSRFLQLTRLVKAPGSPALLMLYPGYKSLLEEVTPPHITLFLYGRPNVTIRLAVAYNRC